MPLDTTAPLLWPVSYMPRMRRQPAPTDTETRRRCGVDNDQAVVEFPRPRFGSQVSPACADHIAQAVAIRVACFVQRTAKPALCRQRLACRVADDAALVAPVGILARVGLHVAIIQQRAANDEPLILAE
jgi:hypothetical protein